MRGYVYVLEAKDHPLQFKVGRTTDLRTRLRAYYGNLPSNVAPRQYVAVWQIDDHQLIENEIRYYLEDNGVERNRNDWFTGDVYEAVDHINKLLQAYKLFNIIDLSDKLDEINELPRKKKYIPTGINPRDANQTRQRRNLPEIVE